CLKTEAFCIRPNLNMINNIGFNKNSTHTLKAPHYKLNNIKVYSLEIDENCQKGKLKIDKQYEVQHVAEYWNGVVINHQSLFKRFKNIPFNRLKRKILNIMSNLK